MLLLLTLLTVGYFVVVLRIRRNKRVAESARSVDPGTLQLPEADRPPVTDAGWPAEGKDLTAYVDHGFAALDAYLSEGSAP